MTFSEHVTALVRVLEALERAVGLAPMTIPIEVSYPVEVKVLASRRMREQSSYRKAFHPGSTSIPAGRKSIDMRLPFQIGVSRRFSMKVV